MSKCYLLSLPSPRMGEDRSEVRLQRALRARFKILTLLQEVHQCPHATLPESRRPSRIRPRNLRQPRRDAAAASATSSVRSHIPKPAAPLLPDRQRSCAIKPRSIQNSASSLSARRHAHRRAIRVRASLEPRATRRRSREQLEALAAWEKSPAFNDSERAVIRYAVETTNNIRVTTQPGTH